MEPQRGEGSASAAAARGGRLGELSSEPPESMEEGASRAPAPGRRPAVVVVDAEAGLATGGERSGVFYRILSNHSSSCNSFKFRSRRMKLLITSRRFKVLMIYVTFLFFLQLFARIC